MVPQKRRLVGSIAAISRVISTAMTRDMAAMEPTSLRFWGTMSLAAIVGGGLAYPINAWLVARGLKHGMGTVRALGKGGHSLEIEREDMARGAVEPPRPTSLPTPAATSGHQGH